MKTDSIRLAEIPLFAGIKGEQLQPMLACLGAYESVYPKGDYLSLAGESLHSAGLVLEGMVHMVKEDIWGGQSLFAIVGENDLFGESFICSDETLASVSFLAAEKSRILFLPFARILHTCSNSCAFHQQLIENMVSLIAKKNIDFINKIDILSRKSIREKVLTYLSEQAQACGQVYFTAPLGRLELADYLCVDRSALTRELAKMKKEGLLDYDRNTFRLL